MKGIEIDPEARTCRAEAGLTWGELDAATQEHGLAVTGGRVSTTGIGGLVLGGGSAGSSAGAATRRQPARSRARDGRRADPTARRTSTPTCSGPLRGGGGNFGVVTRFQFRLHPIGPTVLGGILLYPAPMAPAVLRNFRDAMADAPDEVGAGVALLTAPPEDFVPEPVRGRPVFGVILCYAGPSRTARPPCGRCAASVRRRSTWWADAVPRRSAARSTRRIPPGCATTGPATSSAGCPTRRSTSCALHRPSRRRWGRSCAARRGAPRSRARRHDGDRRARSALQLPHHLAVGGPAPTTRRTSPGRAS